MSDGRRAGFTLIELLVVMAILAILMGLGSSLIATANRSAGKANTQSMLGKVEAALRLYRRDNRNYPYQLSYPGEAPGTPFRDFTNTLAYAVGTDISASNAAKVRADMALAGSAFVYNATINRWYVACSEGVQPSPLTYTVADRLPMASVHGSDYATNDASVRFAYHFNAYQRARVTQAVAAGALDLGGPIIAKPDGTVTVDRSGVRVLATAAIQSGSRPGWAMDYLRGELAAKFLDGDRLVDGYGRGVVYVCRVVSGVRIGLSAVADKVTIPFDPRLYGIGTQGFLGNEGPASAIKTANRALLLQGGRIRLSATDAGDGQPTPTHATYFPDQSSLGHADVRWYATPGMEREFELWSMGPDGAFDWYRDAAVNRDNIPASPNYAKGLP